ncbi:MAG: hypothetical protein KTR31_10375 [Myxococcales bacterium]|nr:hypothetical protein [Myxococcales bacterium]
MVRVIGAGQLLPEGERVRYPRLQADNLLGETLEFPRDLVDLPTLVLLVWARAQQVVADTWLAQVPSLAETVPDLRIVENPVLAPASCTAKGTEDDWVRSPTRTPEGRARTVTLFVSASWLAQALTVTDRSTVTALLLDDEARVAKRWLGPATPERLDDLVVSARQL